MSNKRAPMKENPARRNACRVGRALTTLGHEVDTYEKLTEVTIALVRESGGKMPSNLARGGPYATLEVLEPVLSAVTAKLEQLQEEFDAYRIEQNARAAHLIANLEVDADEFEKLCSPGWGT